MKKVLVRFIFSLLGVSMLTSCSSHHSSNPPLGLEAVSDTASDAVAGGPLGNSMDRFDKIKINQVMTSSPPNKSYLWKNNKTHIRYNVTPTSRTMAYNGNANCRTYTLTAIASNGNQQVTNGTACQQKDGKWLTVKTDY